MTDISRSQAWLESLRPKTLPLAFAAIIVGTVLAWEQGHFDPWVALLALITAGLLQILSNLANDYGDAVKGSDKPDRIGPLRGMQKGVITPQQMKRALIVTVVLICLFGLALLCAAWQSVGDFIGFLAAYAVSTFIATVINLYFLKGLIQISIVDQVKNFSRSILSTGVMIGVVLFVRPFVEFQDSFFGDVLTVGILALAGALAYAAAHTLFWIISGRPEGIERSALNAAEKIKPKLARFGIR